MTSFFFSVFYYVCFTRENCKVIYKDNAQC